MDNESEMGATRSFRLMYKTPLYDQNGSFEQSYHSHLLVVVSW